MAEQLKYCTSIQFFERCKEAGKRDTEIKGGLNHFRSRVQHALTNCFQFGEDGSLDVRGILQSTLQVIDWRQLFENHDAQHNGSNDESVRTALTEVLEAISSVLPESNKDVGVFIFVAWAYHRDRSDDVTMWSNSDAVLFRYLGVHYIKDFRKESNPTAILSWMRLFNACATRVSSDIESTFMIDLRPNNRGCENDATMKGRIQVARSWVNLLRDLNKAIGYKLSREVTYSMLEILNSLDAIDIQNLRIFDVHKSKGKGHESSSSSSTCRKRPRLPSGKRSFDVVEALHDSSLDLGDDRHQRAKIAQMERENCSSMQVSLKQVLTAPAAKNEGQQSTAETTNEYSRNYHITLETYNQSSRRTTLTIDAARLRRDLYLYLLEQDSIFVQEQDCDPGSTIESRLTKLLPTLISRLKMFTSSATRLYTVMTLDHMRQLNLGSKGYVEFMNLLCKRIYLQDNIFGDKGAYYLKLYADIVSECDVYANPKRLVSALSKLIEMSLLPSFRNDYKLMLQSISHILLRRQTVLSQLAGGELKRYQYLLAKLSVEYDDPSHWTNRAKSGKENMELIAALQASGILDLFQSYKSDANEDASQLESSEAHFPYNDHLSLRDAHTRLGPCQGFYNVLSNPLTYIYNPEVKVQLSTADGNQRVSSILPNIDGHGVLHEVLDFLGYRSLARASQCCKAWRDATRSNKRWCRLFFHKFKGAVLEEELSHPDIEKSLLQEVDKRIKFPMSMEGYDWSIIFKHRYVAEKLARSRSIGKTWKPRVCRIVGCNQLISSKHHMAGHLNRHAKQSQALMKKYDKLKAWRVKATELHQTLGDSLNQEGFDPANLDGTVESMVDRPESIMMQLIFPFLEISDLVQPVCKLWTELGKSNSLWYGLYCRHFGEACTKWLPTPMPLKNWKASFKTMYQTKRLVNDDSSMLGWKFVVCPVPCCCSILGSKLEYDLHMIRHELNFLEKLCLRSRGKVGAAKV